MDAENDFSQDGGRTPLAAVPGTTTPIAPSSRVGERLRALRLAAGLTQSEVGGERFSKEYVSQIERGKTRPTDEAVAWLASQLGVDPLFLGRGATTDVRDRVEALLARAEALAAAHRPGEAIDLFVLARRDVGATGSTQLEVRALVGEAWARFGDGGAREAVDLLLVARELAEGPQFSDLDHADLLFRLGACRFTLGSVATAAALFDEALALAEASGPTCDRLRADVLGWRSRCRRRQRDLEAAKADVETALGLTRDDEDRRAEADALVEASHVAEQRGHWGTARTYAEQARTIFRERSSERTAGRLLLDLGSIEFARGEHEDAVAHLTSSLELAVGADSKRDAALALGRLAAVHLERRDHVAAEEHARKALALLDGRDDLQDVFGGSQIVLGRALLEQGRFDDAEACFKVADDVFEQTASLTHRAGAWVALGDLASRRDDDGEAAHWYRRAAEALQDTRF